MLSTGTAAALLVAVPGQSERTMRIRITVQTVAQKRVVRVGDELEVGDSEAQLLIRMHKAEAIAVPSAADAARKPRASGVTGRKAIP